MAYFSQDITVDEWMDGWIAKNIKALLLSITITVNNSKLEMGGILPVLFLMPVEIIKSLWR